MSELDWLSDEAWAVLEPHLSKGRPRALRVDDRRVISGILHVLRSGCRWKDCPREYAPPTTIYNRQHRMEVQSTNDKWKSHRRYTPREAMAELISQTADAVPTGISTIAA